MSRVLFLSHTHRQGTFKVGSFHLSRELARLGHEVAHVSTPVSAAHRVRGADPRKLEAVRQGLVRAADGVLDLVPTTALPARWVWTRRQLDRAMDQVGFDEVDLCFIDQPLIAGPLRGDPTIVFRPTDIKVNPGERRRADRVMEHLAHGLAATSPYVRDSLPNPRNIPTTVIENGCEIGRFSGASDGATGERRGFVYVGALDHRFDADAITTIARAHPDLPVDVYGPASGELRARASGLDNLRFRGAAAYEAVPELLARAKVGLLPFRRTDSNRGRSPMKLYEYLAAGLNIVSSEPVRLAGFDASSFAFTYGTDEELLPAVRAAHAANGDRRSLETLLQAKDWKVSAVELMSFAERL